MHWKVARRHPVRGWLDSSFPPRDVRSRRRYVRLRNTAAPLSLLGGWPAVRTAEPSRLLSRPDKRQEIKDAPPVDPAPGFSRGCKRAPTALRRSFTGSCWPRRLLSVTTFRADVAPPHVGSPSVQTRVAGLAKVKRPVSWGLRPAARMERGHSASSLSVRQVPPAPHTYSSTDRRSRLPGMGARGSRRRLPQCSLILSGRYRHLNDRPRWSWARGSNPHGCAFPVLHRVSRTPSLTERNGTIRGPANGRPPACLREGKLGYQILRSAPEGESRPTPISPTLTSQEIPLSFAFFRVSSRFGAPSRRAVEPPPRVCRFLQPRLNSFLRPRQCLALVRHPGARPVTARIRPLLRRASCPRAKPKKRSRRAAGAVPAYPRPPRHVAVTNAVMPASTFEGHGTPAHVPVRFMARLPMRLPRRTSPREARSSGFLRCVNAVHARTESRKALEQLDPKG